MPTAVTARQPAGVGAGGPVGEGTPPGWEGLRAVLGYGVAITTTCFVAGLVMTWVRYESFAGVGKYAVVAADRGDIFATGVTSLLATVIQGVVVLLAVGIWLWLKRRPEDSILMRLARRSRRVSSPVWGYIRRHPWPVHVLAPLIAVVLARWVLPYTVAFPLAIAAVSSMLAGVVRALAAIVDRVAEGKNRRARWARVPVFLLLASASLFVTYSWILVAVPIVFAVFALVAKLRTRGIPPDVLTMGYLVKRERGLLAAYVAAVLVAFAVASEADQPTGLTLARVTPVRGEAFSAIPLGQHSGRAAFLDERRRRPDGIVELAPGNISTVVVTYANVRGPAQPTCLCEAPTELELQAGLGV